MSSDIPKVLNIPAIKLPFNSIPDDEKANSPIDSKILSLLSCLSPCYPCCCQKREVTLLKFDDTSSSSSSPASSSSPSPKNPEEVIGSEAAMEYHSGQETTSMFDSSKDSRTYCSARSKLSSGSRSDDLSDNISFCSALSHFPIDSGDIELKTIPTKKQTEKASENAGEKESVAPPASLEIAHQLPEKLGSIVMENPNPRIVATFLSTGLSDPEPGINLPKYFVTRKD